jgi:thiamine biosynthesis lipoprotein
MIRRRIVWALLALLLGFAGCRHRPLPSAESRFEFERPQMGLPFRIVLYAPNSDHANRAAEAAWRRIAELNSILSDYEPESELSRLSRSSGSGFAVPVGTDLWNVLSRAQTISQASDGAFDITVGPLVQLWKRARRQRELPSSEKITSARESVGWNWVVLNSKQQTAQLVRPGMRLDPGGIAKGYALDEAAKALRNAGISRYLVSGGGDMVAGEAPPGQPGWKVEVGVFDTAGAPRPRFVSLRKMALATSGDVFQRAEINGVRYSHIVDPRTGIGLTDHSLVTMIGPEGMTVDALSKLVSVLGPAQAFPKLKQFRGVESLVLRKPDARVEEFTTPQFDRFRWPE